MKKTCFVLLCALLLGLAPTTLAAGGEAFSLDGLLAQLLTLFTSPGDDAEMGWQFPPNGLAQASG